MRKSKRFRPHITIGYRDLQVIFDEAWRHFEDLRVDDYFPVYGPNVLRHNGTNWEIIS